MDPPNWPPYYPYNNPTITPSSSAQPYHNIQSEAATSGAWEQGNSNNPLQQQQRRFWEAQMKEMSEEGSEMRNHSLPLARIRKIMKSDEYVGMIAAEAPVILAKACEMFILDLTLRSWNSTEENKRRTLQKTDIASALTTTDMFDFLLDIVPRGTKPPPSGVIMTSPMMTPALMWDQGIDSLGEGAGFSMGLQLQLPLQPHDHIGGWPCLGHDHDHDHTTTMHPPAP